MEILGIIGLVLIVVGYIIALTGSHKDDGASMIAGGISILIGFILLLIVGLITRPREFESSKFNHSIEVRDEVINGLTIKSDTVYIFKRK